MDKTEKNEIVIYSDKRLERLLKLHDKISELIQKFPIGIPSKIRNKITDKLFSDKQMQELILDIQEKRVPPSEADKALLLAADRFTKVFSSLAFLIGTEPIPGPDIALLIPLQMMLISLIAYLSGRNLSTKTTGEFLASVGVNLGAGFVFREAARQLVKLFAGPGNLISGGVAASGTFAIGKAASAYYLEGVKKEDIKGIFSKAKNKFVKDKN
jgi:uncharacterized protein (DUF697 family)